MRDEDRDVRRGLLREMLRIRLVEEEIAKRYHEQEMRCPVHLSIGQEAIAAGVCGVLEREDLVISTHRAHAHYLAKGGDLNAMIAEIYGKVDGCARGRGGSMHLVDLERGMAGSTPIVGSSVPIAVGLAFAASLRGESHVTVVFFGEGMTEEGAFGECLNFAALRALPVIFVCENNLYSVYSPLEVRQPARRDRAMIARAHGIEAHCGDGNDASAVRTAAQAAVRRARNGDGPSYLEFETYRWREHCGPNYDNDIGYRTPEEFEAWRARCPVERMQKELFAQGAMMQAQLMELRAGIEEEIRAAFAFAEASPFPAADELMTGIYA